MKYAEDVFFAVRQQLSSLPERERERVQATIVEYAKLSYQRGLREGRKDTTVGGIVALFLLATIAVFPVFRDVGAVVKTNAKIAHAEQRLVVLERALIHTWEKCGEASYGE